VANIQSSYQEARIPFAKMSFTPDVPSTALGPNEYNAGLNVETDVRGIRSMAGDQAILATVPGTPTYVSGGFRINESTFWFIVATTEGFWWASDGTDDYWHNINPDPAVPFSGYDQSTNITEAWNGTVPIFNDSKHPPMFLPDRVDAKLIPYSNTLPISIKSFAIGTGTVTITIPTQLTAPYASGDNITISGINSYYNGNFEVVTSTTTTITYIASPGAAPPPNNTGTVAPRYSWNVNSNWASYYANFMRLYNTPNVGSILVAGNLTAEEYIQSGQPQTTTQTYAVTVQWSQAFGLNEAPGSWAPTVTNIANQLEVPLRGPCLDAFTSNGQFFLCSYWDTVVFSPLNYSTTSAPILGVRLYNQGRGLLSSNCWANTDKLVYGIDARDIWVFDGNDFTGIGNQRVKNWFYDQLDPAYVSRVFMEVNSQRSQVEIYYTTKPEYASALNPIVNGVPNRMISYRYDLDCWNAPREVDSATMACESPIWKEITDSSLPNWTKNLGSRTVVYARGETDKQLVQKDQGYSFLTSNANPNGNIASTFRRDNIKLIKDYSGKLMVHRILPEVVNMGDNELPQYPSTGNITVTIEGSNSVGSVPTAKTPVTIPIDANGNVNTRNPWAQIDQNAFRVNTIELSDTSNSKIWMCSATTWQVTQVEDDR
jgi:hypothetical protein